MPGATSLGNQTLANAPLTDGVITAVMVTDPHHPLFGQRLSVVSLSCSRGPQFISVAVPGGGHRQIRRSVTDLERPAQAPTSAPRISARRLLVLARYVQSVMATSNKEIVDGVETCCVERTCKANPGDRDPVAALVVSESEAMADASCRSSTATGLAGGPSVATNASGEAPC